MAIEKRVFSREAECEAGAPEGWDGGANEGMQRRRYGWSRNRLLRSKTGRPVAFARKGITGQAYPSRSWTLPEFHPVDGRTGSPLRCK